MGTFTFKDKLWLYQQLLVQTYDDKIFIWRVIKRNRESFTENRNGVFFDLEGVSDATLEELMIYYKVLRKLIEKPYYEEE
jgi:hypothetical protein